MAVRTADGASIRRRARRGEVGATVVALATAGFGVLGTLTRPAEVVALSVWPSAAVAASFLPLGLFLLGRLPHPAPGRLMTAIGLLGAAAALATAWSRPLPVLWVSQWLWWTPFALLPALILVCPDGRLPSRRWRPVAVALGVGGVVSSVGLAGAAATAPATFLTTYRPDLSPLGRVLGLTGVAGMGVTVLAAAAVAASVVVRWWRADTDVRLRLACLAPAGLLLVVGITLDTAGVPYAWLPAVGALPVGLTFAVLRYRLHDLDLLIHRGLVGLASTAAALGVFVLLVPIVVRALGGSDPSTLHLILGLAAVALLPVPMLTHRLVGTLLYGRRSDRYGLLTDVDRRSAHEPDPVRALSALLGSLVDGLRVPYVAVADPDGHVVAEQGRWAGTPVAFGLTSRGETLGDLLVSPRRPGEELSVRERELLAAVAVRAADRLHAARGALDLQRARERLVLAGEEERRRLRRDLHDGVASALTGASWVLAAARRQADPGVDLLLTELAADLRGCSAEVRTLIDGLRPAALDDGLRAALRALATTTGPPRVEVDVRAEVDAVAPAVEVAVYRIVAEAVTNVRKHAHATTCRVVVDRDRRHLVVRITDDGRGPAARSGGRSGVGVTSILTRAEELGGRAHVEFTAEGTRVEALVPLPAPTSILGPDPVPDDVGAALAPGTGHGVPA